MGVNTKVIIRVEESQKLVVLQRVIDIVNTMCRRESDRAFNESGESHKFIFMRTATTYTNSASVRSQDGKTFNIDFGVGDTAKRSMWVFTNCDSDDKDVVEGSKVILDLSTFGKAVEILTEVATKLTSDYEVWMNPNDSESTYTKIETSVAF